MFIINVINSIPSINTHMVNIIFATILIIIIILSVKRTTTNGITTTRCGHFVVTILVLAMVLILVLVMIVVMDIIVIVVAVVVVVVIARVGKSPWTGGPGPGIRTSVVPIQIFGLRDQLVPTNKNSSH